MSGYNPKFDADLKFGQAGEKWLLWLGTDGAKVEVKTERDQWAKTGNVVFEFFCHRRNIKTGIASTEAEYWIQLLSLDGKFEGGLVWRTEALKAFLRKVHGDPGSYGARVLRGGDGGYAEMIVVPLAELHKAWERAKEKPPAV